MMKRNEAVQLLKEHVTTDRVLRHSYAVEGAMRAYAKHFGEDVEEWGLIGLLHDIDFEKYPEEHPMKSPAILKEAGFDDDFITTILSHGSTTGLARDTKAKQCLHAVDEMASFIVAIALMRPTHFDGLKGKSVKKKMKDKAFAKAVNREELTQSREAMGIEFNEHVDIIVAGLLAEEALIQESDYSLLNM